MKHGTNSRRGRNRGNGKRHPSLRTQTFESNGPDGKIRGTAQQVFDRYLALGRDAFSAGDPIAAESFYQHAEHYYRLLHILEGNGAERSSDHSRNKPPGVGEPQAEEPMQPVPEPSAVEAPATGEGEPLSY